MALNAKQLKYAKERANGLSPRDAALAAGYAPNSVHVTASRMDQRADVKKAVANFKRNPESSSAAAESAAEDEAKPLLKLRYDSPLALIEDLMNNAKAPVGLRFEAAKLALPYRHGKVGETGKKEAAEKGAKAATASGRFAQKRGPGRPPSRVMN